MSSAAALQSNAQPSAAELLELVRLAEQRFETLRAELQRSHEKLRDLQELHDHTVELSHQLVWAADAEGRIISAGRRLYETMGVDPEVTPHDAWLLLLHPDDVERIQAAWAAACAAGVRFEGEFRMRRPDGSYGTFLARAAPQCDERGRTNRWYGMTEDVTEARQAEAAHREAERRLRESEERHRFTIELVDQIVWTTEADGSGSMVAPRFFELTGLPEGALAREAVHPDDKATAVAAWRKSIGSGQAHDHEFRFVMRDGSARHFRARAAARKDADGRVIRWYGTFEDIHERKVAEQATVEAEERYRLAARATNDAIWDLDLVRDQIWWNEPAQRMFGLPEHGNPTSLGWWEDRLHPDDRDRVSVSFLKAIEGKRSHWSASYRFRKTDGVYAEILDRGYLIRDPSGRALRAVGAMLDLTERRHAQAEIQRIQSELIHVSRLSAMGAMASTLAHELNQPLTAISGYIRGSRRLLEPVVEPDLSSVKEALEAAETGALRAGQIVRRLRELVARGNVAVKPEDLSRLVEEASELAFVDEYLHGVTHRIELDPDARWVEADRIQVQQVLINLVRNAVQAMADQPTREILIRSRRGGHWLVEIAVIDTGPGIPPERMETLFTPFNSSKADGLGIGLSICRTIVEAHGGRIWAENLAEGGAAFHFTLPRAEELGPPEA